MTFVCSSLQSIRRTAQPWRGSDVHSVQSVITGRDAIIFCGYGVDFDALREQIDGAVSCRVFTKFGLSKSLHNLVRRRGYEVNSSGGKAGSLVERALSREPETALFLFLTQSQLKKSFFLDVAPSNWNRIFVCERKDDARITFEFVSTFLKERKYLAVSVNDILSREGRIDVAEYIEASTLVGDDIVEKLIGKNVTIFCESATSGFPFVNLVSRASSTKFVISREPTEEELDEGSLTSLNFLHYGIDIAAPYTAPDVQAAAMAIEHSRRMLDAMYATLSKHSEVLKSEIKEHLGLSLEDTLYTLFRRQFVAKQLACDSDSTFLVQASEVRLQTLIAVYSAARERGADVYLCASKSPSSSRRFLNLLRRMDLLIGKKFFAIDHRKDVNERGGTLRIPDFQEIGRPLVAVGDALIVAAGDRNYSDTVHAVAKAAAGSRGVRVWSVDGSYDPTEHGVVKNVSVEPVLSAKPEARAKKKIEAAALEFAKTALLDKRALDPATRPLVCAGFTLWFVNSLPFLCQWYKSACQSMAQGRPAYVIACSGRIPLSRLAIQAAKTHGIPTLEAQAVLLSDYIRIKRPITDYVSVIDSISQDLMEHHFKLETGRIVRAGSARIQKLIRASGGRPSEMRPKSKTVLLATQPLDSTLCLNAAQYLMNTVGRVPGARLLIRLHPREGVATRRKYADLIERNDASGYCELLPKAPLFEALEKTSIVVTFFSNVGLEAAVFGADVLTLAYDGHFPMDFRKGGMAIAASTPDEIDHILQAYLNDEEFRAQVRSNRLQFLKSNEQLFLGDPGERIVRAMESNAAAA